MCCPDSRERLRINILCAKRTRCRHTQTWRKVRSCPNALANYCIGQSRNTNGLDQITAKKIRAHLFSSYRLNLQALMTLRAFSSSRLRLSFIFLSLASLMISRPPVYLGFCHRFFTFSSGSVFASRTITCHAPWSSSPYPGCGSQDHPLDFHRLPHGEPRSVTLELGRVSERVFSVRGSTLSIAATVPFSDFNRLVLRKDSPKAKMLDLYADKYPDLYQ